MCNHCINQLSLNAVQFSFLIIQFHAIMGSKQEEKGSEEHVQNLINLFRTIVVLFRIGRNCRTVSC